MTAGKPTDDPRRARLAQALRANLKRRKAGRELVDEREPSASDERDADPKA